MSEAKKYTVQSLGEFYRIQNADGPALGMGQLQACTLKRSLKYTHQIQMGYPNRISRFFKQSSKHRIPPPAAIWRRRSRHSRGDNPESRFPHRQVFAPEAGISS